MNLTPQLRITLKNTSVERLVLRQADAEAAVPLKLSFTHSLLEHARGFLLKFDCELRHKDNLELQLVFVAEFATDETIAEIFFNEHFAKVNAPAIAYPFLRAYIANLFVASGYDALMLPTVNFQAMAEQKEATVAKG